MANVVECITYLKSEVAHSSTREGRSVFSLPASLKIFAKYLKSNYVDTIEVNNGL